MSKVLLFLLALSGCTNNTPSTNDHSPSISSWHCPNNAHNTPKLLIFGDSLAANPNGWAVQLATLLNMEYQNFAVNGSSMFSDNQHKTIMCIQINNDDIVVFQPGMNDIFNYGLDPNYLNNYSNALKDIIKRVNDAGAIGLFGTTSKILNDLNGIDNSMIEEYANIMSSSVNGNVLLIDTYNQFTPTIANMSDVVHPNGIGYAEIANLFFSKL